MTEKDSDAEPAVKLIAYDAMTREFVFFKGKLQSTFDCNAVGKFSFQNNVAMKKDVERAGIFVELMRAGQAWAPLGASYLQYCWVPAG